MGTTIQDVRPMSTCDRVVQGQCGSRSCVWLQRHGASCVRQRKGTVAQNRGRRAASCSSTEHPSCSQEALPSRRAALVGAGALLSMPLPALLLPGDAGAVGAAAFPPLPPQQQQRAGTAATTAAAGGACGVRPGDVEQGGGAGGLDGADVCFPFEMEAEEAAAERRASGAAAGPAARPSPLSAGQALPLYATFLMSAAAACTAETLTLPLDMAKVRLQLQASSPNPEYRGLLGTVLTIWRQEGPAALWKGLEPGLHRQFLNGGLRIALYEPVKELVASTGVFGGGPPAAYAATAAATTATTTGGLAAAGDVPLSVKVVAGLLTGALAITVANPTDVLKVRMQAEGRLPEGAPRRYPSALAAYGIIAREEGVGGLWTGWGPNVARNALINAAELASYDQVKQSLLATGVFQDDVATHLLSGLGAGFFAVCVGSPVDVIKSRMMGNTAAYSGALDCLAQTLARDRPLALYKGFVPNFARIGSWNAAMFLVLEQLKRALAAAML